MNCARQPHRGDLRTGLEALGQVLDGEFLILERRPVLVVQPPKLLQDLGVVRVLLHDALVRVPRADVLQQPMSQNKHVGNSWKTHVTLLLEYVPDLEPDVGVGEGARRVAEDTIETL